MKKLLIQSELHKDEKMISGLVYHRQIVPHHYLSDHENYKCDIMNSIGHLPDEKLREYDGCIFLRNSDAYGNYPGLIQRIKKLGLKVIFDIDDYWNLSPNHSLTKLYKQFNIPEKTELDILNSDLITTTTVHFAKEISKINPNVFVLPNCLDTKNPQWKENKIDSHLIRFGWIGGMFHKHDLSLMRHSIEKTYKNLKGFQFCLGGFNPGKEYIEMEKMFTCNYSALSEDYKKYLAEKTPVADHISYYQPYRRLWGIDVFKYGTLYDEIDVALVPLENNKFNGFKSEIKLIEAGTKGCAAIVSKVKPYDIFPDNCVHYVEDNYSGWFKAMRMMINEPDYRKELATNLSEYVKKNYSIKNYTNQRREIYDSLWK